ncbi:MAG: hypothetical protein HY286_16950 [Planctomycetes bacterium]|nr:hypothetical protein [Planctomycetota bacterium]
MTFESIRSAPRLTGFALARPRIELPQAEAREFALRIFNEMRGVERLMNVFENAGVASRQIVIPMPAVVARSTPTERNDDYITHSVELLESAARDAMVRAGVAAGDITHVLLISSTGLANPTLDTRLSPALGLKTTVRRVPVWGLGCGGGAQGLAIAADLARSGARARVLLLAVELCSLTFVPTDLTPGNLVATALFGDGAAAAIVENGAAADGKPGIVICDSEAARIPETLDAMGWKIVNDGWRVVFSTKIPALVREHAPRATTTILERNRLSLGELRGHVLHPGGPAILDAYEEALGLPPDATKAARAALRAHGNCSSVSIFQTLERTPAVEGPLLFSAFGPGFAAEVLLGWRTGAAG